MANESAVERQPGSPALAAAGTRERPGQEAPGAGSPNGVGGGEQQGSAGTQAPPDPRRRTITGIIVAILVVIALIYGVRYYQYSQTHASTDDAYVTGNLVNVSPIISGTLSTLTVDEGDSVTKGQLIARLDDSGEIAALHQAQDAYKAAQSQIPQAETSLAYQQASTDAAILHAQAALRVQDAKTAGAQAQVLLTQSTVDNQVAQARQQVAAAEAMAAQSDAQVAALEAAEHNARQAVQTAKRSAAAVTENVASAKANYDKSLADLLRYRKLLAQQAVTQEQYDSVNAGFITSEAQLNAAKDQASQAQSQVDQAVESVVQADAQEVAGSRAAAAAKRQVDVARAGLALAQANEMQMGVQSNNYASNQHQGTEAQADLAAAQAGNQEILLRRQQIDTLNEQAAQSKAALANAQVAEDDCTIVAPSDGMVVRKGVNVGAALTPGQTILTMTAGHDVWVEANYKETQMDGVHPGEEAEVDVDAIPGKIFKGKVLSINEATGASTALLPPDNATGNFTKVVQRIPVKIVLVPATSSDGSQYATADDISNLRQGMSVTATIHLSK